MGRKLDACLSAINEVVLGKEAQVRLAMTCLVGGGHLLIEDLPGMGKTTLSHALAKILGLSYQRIQFTSDLLPGDILGTSVFDRDSGQFTFHPGPIFAELVLADEINRATPKSQSALLEAMEEGQVSIEGATRLLPDPFFVIATQNPFSSGGTFALPESQLDRFMMRISMGYPARAAEKALLLGESRRELLPRLQPILDHALLGQFQAQARQVRASDALVDYV
ncbi:AAA family ATPase, partial [Pseudomonas syringae]